MISSPPPESVDEENQENRLQDDVEQDVEMESKENEDQDVSFPPLPPPPTAEDENYPLFEEEDAVPTWEDDLYARLGAESDDEANILDNPYYMTLTLQEAVLDKTNLDFLQSFTDLEILSRENVVDQPGEMLTIAQDNVHEMEIVAAEKDQVVMNPQEIIVTSLKKVLESLDMEESKKPSLTPQELFEILVQRRTDGVAVPNPTRVPDQDSQSILNDMIVAILPNLHGVFGADRLPEQNMATTDAMLGLLDEPEQKDEVIQCICDNPTIDYGLFMIACDVCQHWFHGHCVGVQSELPEWKCPRHRDQ